MSGQLASESARLLIALGCLKFVTLLSASSSSASTAISRHMTSFALTINHVLQDRCCEAQINAPLKFYI